MKKIGLTLFVALIAAGCFKLEFKEHTIEEVSKQRFTLQLTEDINLEYTADIYIIDALYSTKDFITRMKQSDISPYCLFSVGVYEVYEVDQDKFAPSDLGEVADEMNTQKWVNIASGSIRKIMGDRIALARDKDCDGVVFAHIDSYKHKTGFDIDKASNLAYLAELTQLAKHAKMQVGVRVNMQDGFEAVAEVEELVDFALSEECIEYHNCHTLAPFIDHNKSVFNVEYNTKYLESKVYFDSMCINAHEHNVSTSLLPKLLDGTFWFDCE
mgnify:FL=1